jgi:hypothetical protein
LVSLGFQRFLCLSSFLYFLCSRRIENVKMNQKRNDEKNKETNLFIDYGKILVWFGFACKNFGELFVIL